jgi:hypothetical protein
MSFMLPDMDRAAVRGDVDRVMGVIEIDQAACRSIFDTSRTVWTSFGRTGLTTVEKMITAASRASGVAPGGCHDPSGRDASPALICIQRHLGSGRRRQEPPFRLETCTSRSSMVRNS